MKKLLLYLLLIISAGCSAVPKKVTECPERPEGKLAEKDVESLSSSELSKPLIKSGEVTSNRSVGYQIDGKAGQSLKVSTKDNNICFGIYTIDNKPIKGGNLTKDGIYMVQVFVPNGSSKFRLELSLENTAVSDASTTSTAPSVSTPSVSSNTSNFTEIQASQLIQNWLNAKSKIFAPPFDQDLMAKYSTQKRYNKNLGAIKWLQENNAYYQYRIGKVESSSNFSTTNIQAQIDVNITEDLTLYINSRVDNNSSTFSPITKVYRFRFALDNGIWKIDSADSL